MTVKSLVQPSVFLFCSSVLSNSAAARVFGVHAGVSRDLRMRCLLAVLAGPCLAAAKWRFVARWDLSPGTDQLRGREEEYRARETIRDL